MSEKRLVPKRRFKGFEGEWELVLVEEIAEVNPPSTIPQVFRYVDLESVVGTQIINHRLINCDNAPSRAQRLAKKGDIFYQTVRPYQRNNYLYVLRYTNFVFSTGYTQLRPKINSEFLFTKLTTKKFLIKVLARCTGTSFPAVSSKDLIKININIPLNSIEPQKS